METLRNLGIVSLSIPAWQMALFIGHARGGWAGFLVSGLGFVLPATVMVTVFAWAYVRFGALPSFPHFFEGIKPVVLALIVGSVCFKFRLKTFYFAVVTLAFAEMIRLVVMNWNSVTNGTLGLVVAGKPTIYWPGSGIIPIKGPIAWYYLTLVCLSVTVLICARCLRSWMGRCFGAIRLNEDLARTLGINVFRYKLLSFSIGSALASFAGGLYGYYTGYIDPGYLSINQSMEVLAMVLLGGQGTLIGPIVGSLVLTGLPHAIDLRAEIRAMLYGAILVLVISFLPQGLVGFVRARRGGSR